jgi:hypothetical protein
VAVAVAPKVKQVHAGIARMVMAMAMATWVVLAVVREQHVWGVPSRTCLPLRCGGDSGNTPSGKATTAVRNYKQQMVDPPPPLGVGMGVGVGVGAAPVTVLVVITATVTMTLCWSKRRLLRGAD